MLLNQHTYDMSSLVFSICKNVSYESMIFLMLSYALVHLGFCSPAAPEVLGDLFSSPLLETKVIVCLGLNTRETSWHCWAISQESESKTHDPGLRRALLLFLFRGADSQPAWVEAVKCMVPAQHQSPAPRGADIEPAGKKSHCHWQWAPSGWGEGETGWRKEQRGVWLSVVFITGSYPLHWATWPDIETLKSAPAQIWGSTLAGPPFSQCASSSCLAPIVAVWLPRHLGNGAVRSWEILQKETWASNIFFIIIMVSQQTRCLDWDF